MNRTGVALLLKELHQDLTVLLDVLATEEFEVMDPCERLDLWQDAHAVRARLGRIESTLVLIDRLAALDPTAGSPAARAEDQAALIPSATDISLRRRSSAERTRRRSPPSSSPALTGLRSSR